MVHHVIEEQELDSYAPNVSVFLTSFESSTFGASVVSNRYLGQHEVDGDISHQES